MYFDQDDWEWLKNRYKLMDGVKNSFPNEKLFVRLLFVRLRNSILAALALNAPNLAIANAVRDVGPNSGFKEGGSLFTEAELLEVENRQEWNQLIQDDFRKLTENFATEYPPPSLESLSARLNSLYFDVLSTHLASLQGPFKKNDYPGDSQPQLIADYSKQNDYPYSTAPVSNAPAAQIPRELGKSLFIEALDPYQTSVDPVEVEPISIEYSQNGKYERGWNFALASGHWPTLFWKDTEFHPADSAESIPLMSHNTLFSFANAKLAGMNQQAGAGVIFGTLAAGWQIEIASSDVIGQSDPLFLDKQSK